MYNDVRTCVGLEILLKSICIPTQEHGNEKKQRSVRRAHVFATKSVEFAVQIGRIRAHGARYVVLAPRGIFTPFNTI